MHDKHGRLIELGDLVIVRGYASNVQVPQAARVVATTPGATSCNVQAEYAQTVRGYFNAGECELVAKADGTKVE